MKKSPRINSAASVRALGSFSAPWPACPHGSNQPNTHNSLVARHSFSDTLNKERERKKKKKNREKKWFDPDPGIFCSIDCKMTLT